MCGILLSTQARDEHEQPNVDVAFVALEGHVVHCAMAAVGAAKQAGEPTEHPGS